MDFRNEAAVTCVARKTSRADSELLLGLRAQLLSLEQVRSHHASVSGGDGCCPDGANATTDSDCEPRCGNGVREPGEACDGSSCPSSCPEDSNPCTTNRLRGSRSSCDAACVEEQVTEIDDDDGCCPTGTSSGADADCGPPCGNGRIDSGEACDDTNDDNNDGCTNECELNVCGDRVWKSKGSNPEECDIGDRSDLPDGRVWDAFSCSTTCRRQYAYTPCSVASDCGSLGICDQNRGNICLQRCSTGTSCLAASNVAGYCVSGTACFVRCDAGQTCPPSSTCQDWPEAMTRICVPR
jgi:cysteine-rich repeat protein